MIDKKHITGIILAGGKSSRMGTDKGFLLLNKKPFVKYSIDALEPLVSEIIIVSDNEAYDAFGVKRVDDIMKDAGPIAGIYSGLVASKNEYNIILSCDIPLVNSNLLKKLVLAIDDISEIIQVESNGKSMPLIAMYKKACKDIFKEVFDTGERRLRMAIKACNSKNITLETKEEVLTTNVNTKDQFKTVENEYNR
ncbi:molybdenum cofactor guanylyltransferase [Pontimicrobium sp. IMCC45349]|uniref:molybdenum cofactor guanylyltransferase n=1 Tax=Pontimicrobium sp. IMCC45349 TaxID=3391574 RepID=UPI0039A090D5